MCNRLRGFLSWLSKFRALLTSRGLACIQYVMKTAECIFMMVPNAVQSQHRTAQPVSQTLVNTCKTSQSWVSNEAASTSATSRTSAALFICDCHHLLQRCIRSYNTCPVVIYKEEETCACLCGCDSKLTFNSGPAVSLFTISAKSCSL